MSTHHFHRVTNIVEERRQLPTGSIERRLTITTENGTVEISLFAKKLEFLTSNRLKNKEE